MSDPSTVPTASRGRLILARTLVVVGLVLGLISLFSGYVRWQVFDTPTFEKTASELIANDAIRSQVASNLSAQLFANVDVQAELESKLPADQKGLAGPLTGALSQLSDRAAYELLGRPRVQDIFVNAAVASHDVAIHALQNDLGPVETRDGYIVLNLRDAVVQLGDQLSFLGNLEQRLPADVGVIKLAQANQFETAQNITQAFERIAPVLPVLTFLLLGVGIWLARGRRRRELRAVAVGLIVIGLLVLVLRKLAGGMVVDQLSPTASTDEAVRSTWDIVTSLLADGAWTVIILGIAGLIGVWLSATKGIGARARHALAPTLARRGLSYGSAAVILLLLVWWQPTAQFGRPWAIAFAALLLAVGVEALRALAVREEPDAAAVDPLERLRESFTRTPSAPAATPPAPTPAPPPPSPDA